MKPWVLIDREEGPKGDALELVRRDTELAIRTHGRLLMSSRQHGSEEAMADVLNVQAAALSRARGPRRILVGGLGLGYTLRAVLDRLRPGDAVTVAELSPAIVAWNRGVLAELAARPLEDPRVRLIVADVGQVLRTEQAAFDAVLLDVDNGPEALSTAGNRRLYDTAGLAWLRDALRPAGTAVVWSAGEDPSFEARLRRAGFTVSRKPVSARNCRGGTSHVLFVATRAA